MTEEDVFPIAQEAGRVYCRLYGADEQFDDAVGDSALYLLTHRQIWNKPSNSILVRVVGALVRNYQKEHGLRLKNPPKIYNGAFDVDAYVKEESSANQPDQRVKLIEQTINRPFFQPFRDAILELVDGQIGRREIAKRHGLSLSKLKRIYLAFKTACISGATSGSPDASSSNSVSITAPVGGAVTIDQKIEKS